MPSILAGNHWDEGDDHISSIGMDELRALTRSICTTITGMKDSASFPAQMPQPIQTLAKYLKDEVPPEKIFFIIKGVHQPSQLHYTMKCRAINSSAFHIYLGQGLKHVEHTRPLKPGPNRTGLVGKVAPVNLFEYKPVGISVHSSDNNDRVDATVLHVWPPQFNPDNSYPGRIRGNSFSAGNVAKVKGRGPQGAEISSTRLVDKPK